MLVLRWWLVARVWRFHFAVEIVAVAFPLVLFEFFVVAEVLSPRLAGMDRETGAA